ncbi:MAG: hypothetical protein NC124_18250 [Clostridium sp.]|nr:hypothetical protein [Clostridium sp.]MCM1564192.1 hypothetical protein [Clostridium sp.]
MKNENIILLNKIITAKSNELGFGIMKPEHSGTVISLLREDWHLFIEIHNPLVPSLSLQMSIWFEDKAVQTRLFPSPSIINSGNVYQFLRLSNVANQRLGRRYDLGRFWVDEESFDLAYELILEEYLIEHYTEEVGKQLFEIPLAHFRDCHIPLMMLAGNAWKADTAISYLKELWENGYVDNRKYDLW